jgi:signal transduction histidine kinase
MQAQDKQEGEQEDASFPVRTTALVAELLASVSHELRTPLATIKAYTATLLRPRRSLSRTERRAFLLAIERASEHLEVVIDHLLEMASLETGTLALELSTVNLAQLIRETISAAEHRADAEQVNATQQLHRTLRFHLEHLACSPGDEVFFIEADHHRLRKVLDQLLENAITYSPEGGTIEVSLRTLSPSARAEHSGLSPPGGGGFGSQMAASHQSELPGGQQWVEISVRDEGLGIAAEHIERVFDPFYRVDTRLARDVNGLGIGLAICKRIVELHGGAIWVESTVGTGSTFHVRLPRGGPRAPST